MAKTFTYTHSTLVPYTAQQVYAVVDDVAHYHQFLPNCKGSGVVSRSPQDQGEKVIGYMDLAVIGMQYRLESHNLHCAPTQVQMQLLKGPFKSLTGQWDIKPLGDMGCKVSLDMRWEFDSALLTLTVGQRFESIAQELLDAFIAETARRAQ